MILALFPFRAELEAFLNGANMRKEEECAGTRLFASDSLPDWRMAVCGQGKVEAALACRDLAAALEPQILLLIGSAVALAPALRIGDVVLADPCLEWDFEADSPPRFRPSAPFPSPTDGSFLHAGPVLSGDRDVFDPASKAELGGRYGALAAAWEGAGFHRCLRRTGRMGWEARIITESSGEGRLALPELHARMRAHFPMARNRLRAAMQDFVRGAGKGFGATGAVGPNLSAGHSAPDERA